MNTCFICTENDITKQCSVCSNGTCKTCEEKCYECPFCRNETFGKLRKLTMRNLFMMMTSFRCYHFDDFGECNTHNGKFIYKEENDVISFKTPDHDLTFDKNVSSVKQVSEEAFYKYFHSDNTVEFFGERNEKFHFHLN